MKMETTPPNTPSPGQTAPPTAPPCKTNWRVFWVVLLAPGLLSIFGAATNSDAFWTACMVLGSPLAGLVCGVLVARVKTWPAAQRVIYGGFIAIGLSFVSFLLCFVGCVFASR